MKKLLSIIMVAGLIGAATSCNGDKKSNSDEGAVAQRTCDVIEDSISQTIGSLIGSDLNMGLNNPEVAQNLDKEQLLNAIVNVIKLDTTKKEKSYLQGLRIGLQIYDQIEASENQGININRKLVIDEFKKAFNSKDSIDVSKLQALNGKLMQLTKKEIKAKGEKYIEEQTKKDKGYKKTQSGIAYKIIKEGEGENFSDSTAVVDVIYVGKHINGKVFDDSKGKPVPFNLQQVVPGFSEVIKLMKPGSKVIAIIPGKMAYGEQGNPRGGIAPNETLVFEMTTVGIHEGVEDARIDSYPGRPMPMPNMR